MAEHPPVEPLAPPAPAAADASPAAPAPRPAASAQDLTAHLLPLIDHAVQHAVQHAVAPLAETIAQQTATIDRLATALHALLPRPTPRMRQDPPPPRSHALQAYHDASEDSADPDRAAPPRPALG